MKKRSLTLLSGGMDSIVTLSEAIKVSDELFVLHMDYGQKTSKKEQLCFEKICEYYKIPKSNQKIIKMDFLSQIGGSSLTDSKIDVSDFEGDSNVIPSSYVPFRNSIILSLATSWAEVIQADSIYIGANQEDSPGYPDCREEYFEVFNDLIHKGSKAQTIKLITPVLKLNKSQIIELAHKNKAPLELTWSCYKSSDHACGVCDSCALRLRGFKKLGLKDPINYISTIMEEK